MKEKRSPKDPAILLTITLNVHAKLMAPFVISCHVYPLFPMRAVIVAIMIFLLFLNILINKKAHAKPYEIHTVSDRHFLNCYYLIMETGVCQ